VKVRNYLGIFITTLFVVFVVVANQIFSLGMGEKITTFISPIGIVVSTTGKQISSFFGNVTHIGSLQRENKDLEGRLDSALAEIARLTESKKENDSLRADLGFKQNSSLNLVPADVAYFDPSLRDGITVKVASSDGIKVGNVALSQGFMIGRVSEISGNNIKILLITDSTSALPATLQSKDITGIAKGKIGNGLTMEQVPQSDNVVSGDTVVTSGLGGDIPKGLILGKVEEVQKVSGSIFQNVIVRPAVEFALIERVMIAR
jgi:rod shape-determining protein MreC